VLTTSENMLREVIISVVRLPEEDLPLVAEFVGQLRQRHAPHPNLVALRAEVQRKAALLAEVPREQLAAQFLQLVDELRDEAVAHGVALSAEPEGD